MRRFLKENGPYILGGAAAAMFGLPGAIIGGIALGAYAAYQDSKKDNSNSKTDNN
jgi:hypothetical protein